MTVNAKERISSYTYGQGRTNHGQTINFSYSTKGDVKTIREFLENNIVKFDIPVTKKTNNSHGTIGWYSRYKMTQHKYAGGGNPGKGGFIEVLEIKNTPENRTGIIIYEYNTNDGSVFTEWDTLQSAIKVFEDHCNNLHYYENEEIKKLPGFKRLVKCSIFTPWFYAIGDEELIGDFVVPHGIQDDPVFRFGKKFVVTDEGGGKSVKTCFGCRFVSEEVKRDHPRYGLENSHYRLVYFDDGSVWDERSTQPWYSSKFSNAPSPLEDDQEWITEAVAQFKKMLSGEENEFTINFTNGNKFVGKMIIGEMQEHTAEGNYLVKLHIKDRAKPKEGWVNDFKPTPEVPTVEQVIRNLAKENNKVIEKIEIMKIKTKKAGKKWSGVFFSPSENNS